MCAQPAKQRLSKCISLPSFKSARLSSEQRRERVLRERQRSGVQTPCSPPFFFRIFHRKKKKQPHHSLTPPSPPLFSTSSPNTPIYIHQPPGNPSPKNLPPNTHLLSNNHPLLLPAQTRPRGDSTHSSAMGPRRRRRESNHGAFFKTTTNFTIIPHLSKQPLPPGQNPETRIPNPSPPSSKQVGDSLDDMAAGYRASAATVLLSPSPSSNPTLTAPSLSPSPPTASSSSSSNTTTSPPSMETVKPSSSSTESQETLRRHEFTGLWIERLDELIGILEGGFLEGEGERERGE